MRARVVGDLPVALGIKEMMRQVHALQLAVTGVYVDGEGNKIGDCPTAPATVEKDLSKSWLTNNVTFYSQQFYNKQFCRESRCFELQTFLCWCQHPAAR